MKQPLFHGIVQPYQPSRFDSQHPNMIRSPRSSDCPLYTNVIRIDLPALLIHTSPCWGAAGLRLLCREQDGNHREQQKPCERDPNLPLQTSHSNRAHGDWGQWIPCRVEANLLLQTSHPNRACLVWGQWIACVVDRNLPPPTSRPNRACLVWGRWTVCTVDPNLPPPTSRPNRACLVWGQWTVCTVDPSLPLRTSRPNRAFAG